MLKIKFSHKYPKLHGQTTATLLAVRDLSFPKDKNEDLIEYDTKYVGFVGKGYFPLPNGEYIQLIFVGNKHIPFCTVRPKYSDFSINKKEYYEGLIGQDFEIVVKGE